jgi:hypothetical protein
MLSVVSSPTRVYVIIESWNISIVSPAPVIIMRAVPPTFPETPPPAAPEIKFNVYIRINVHIVRIRQHYHSRRCGKHDGRRQADADTNVYIYLCHCWNRN